MITFLTFVLLLVALVATGVRLISWLDPKRHLFPQGYMAVVGLGGSLVLGFSILALSVVTGKLGLSIYLVAFFLLLLCGRYCFRTLSSKWQNRPSFSFHFKWYKAVVVLIWIILLAVIGQVLVIDAHGFPQATLIGWGDVAYHLDMVRHLSVTAPFTLDQPIASGAVLTYPFFINFVSAILLHIGFPILLAWHLPMFFFATILVVLLFSFAQRILKSNWFAVAALALVLFGGGVGWYVFGQDVGSAWKKDGFAGVVSVLDSPPHEYTHLDNRTGGKPKEADSDLSISWITPAISFFSHQRSFVPGFALALLIFLGWLIYGVSKVAEDQKVFARWLVLLGFLPLTHSHTALALGMFFAVLFCQKIFLNRGGLLMWVWGALGAFLIALPQLILIGAAGSGSGGGQFFQPWFGWMTCPHWTNWFLCSPSISGTVLDVAIFWFKNTGVILVGWLVALFCYVLALKQKKDFGAASLLVIPSLVLFIVPNFLKFQPWEFDNNKVIMYWFFFAIILMLAAVRIITLKYRPVYRGAVLVFIVLLGCTAGLVDVSTRVHATFDAVTGKNVRNHAGYYGKDEIVATEWITKNTLPNEAFLSSDSPSSFIPMLSGRSIFLGFSGWLWSQGNNATVNERKQIVTNFIKTKNSKALCDSNVRWLMWETGFVKNYPAAVGMKPEDFGAVRFRQNTPYGERIILSLSCE